MTLRIPVLLSCLAGLLAIYLIAPLAAGAREAWFADWRSVDTTALAHACVISLTSATIATMITAVTGIPLGYLLARVPGRAMAALGFLVQLPLALPPLASGILLLFLVGYGAPLGRLTAGALTDSFAGIVLAETFVAAPFVIIAARSAFAAVNPELEGVAATLGRRPLHVFFRVSLPIAGPAILAGLLLAWLRAFGEFGATVMVAYHPYSLPVYTYVAFGAQGLPAMLPVLAPTLVLALAVMVLGTIAGSRAESVRAVSAPAGAGPMPSGLADSAKPSKPVAASSSVGPALKLDKRLGSFHLRVTWAPKARRLAILGPSGSGKSLTLKIIAGIAHCDRGDIILDGKDILPLAPAARRVAYVPQNYALFPHLDVMQHLLFPAGSDAGQAARWIARLSLRGLERRRPDALSLGQQQRVALARALVRPARLLLLDEPFSALDAPLRLRLGREMLALQAELAAATMLVTHDPAEAALLADELLLLDGGRVLQAGPTEQVFRRPANATAARLLGAGLVAEGVAAGADSIAIGGGVQLEVAGPALRQGAAVGWSVPAVHVRMNAAGRYQGRVESVTAVAAGRRITLRVGDALVEASAGYIDPPCGSSCRLDIAADAVRVWPLDKTC